MKKYLMLLLLTTTAHAQRVATIANFGARAVDTAQTCYYMKTVPGWHEQFQSFDSCTGVASLNATFAIGSWWLERKLQKNHPKLARLPQWISFAGSVSGIAYNITRRK